MSHGPAPKVIEKNISPVLFDSHVFIQDNGKPVIEYKVAAQRVRITKKAEQKNQTLQQVNHCVLQSSGVLTFRSRENVATILIFYATE